MRMHLGLPDASGRQSVDPIAGSHFTVKADLVIKALGFDPEELPRMFNEPGLEVNRWGTLKVNPRSFMTALPGVFAAGDIVRGASLVVWAIRDGRDAAEKIDDYILQPDRARRGRSGVTLMRSRNPAPSSSPTGRPTSSRLSGTYDVSQEHDACGVGLIAALDGKKRRDVVEAGIAALKAVWHRGAVDADGKTGDGAGIHIEIPQDFFAAAIERGGDKLKPGPIAVGQVFLPKTDLGAQERCRQIVETEILNFGYAIYGWRQVPINVEVIGEKANATRPEIEQIMIWNAKGVSDIEFERDLYVIRRRIEKQAIAAQISELYFCSLSSRSIIYKGMFLAQSLTDFYPDLLDPRFVSRFAIYHQRYSTNTFPTWRLAQPFRMLAHNGEINTVIGNTNWMKSHETRLNDAELGPFIEDIKPVIQAGSSDTAALDAAFELLVRGGRDAPMTKAMLIPTSISSDATMPKAHRDMFLYCSAIMEPWDGPAAVCATDGRWVIAGLDRNGLRPLRYTLTNDHLLIVGSETGMVKVDPASVTERGRVGPGHTIGIDLDTATFYRDDAMKDLLSVAPSLRRMDQPHPRDRQHRQDRCAGARAVFQRRTAPPPAQRRLHAGGAGDDPASDGGGRRRSRRQHGRRHAHRRAVRTLSRPAPLLPPELQPGHEPADRQPARNPRDVAQDAPRQSRQRARRERQPARPPAARQPGAVERRVRGDARSNGRLVLRRRLHLPGRRRARAACGPPSTASAARPRKACAPAARTSS